MNYYDTTNVNGPALDNYIQAADTQDKKILAFFRAHAGVAFSPDEVHQRLFSDNTPITSIRRSITNLTQDNLLVKSWQKKMSSYGRPTHAWYAPATNQQLNLFS